MVPPIDQAEAALANHFLYAILPGDRRPHEPETVLHLNTPAPNTLAGYGAASARDPTAFVIEAPGSAKTHRISPAPRRHPFERRRLAASRWVRSVASAPLGSQFGPQFGHQIERAV